MNPHKKWKRYTQVGDLFINLPKYAANLQPQDDGCIVWRGPKHKQGYGMVPAIRAHDQKRVMTVTHRVAMRLHLDRAIDSTEEVRHACGNNACCNGNHLYFRNTPPKEIEYAKPTTTEIFAPAK